MTPDDAAAAAVLAGLPGVGPARLRLVLAHHPPSDAVAALGVGRPLHDMVMRAIPAAVRDAMRRAVRAADLERAGERLRQWRIDVVAHGEPAYPAPLAHDPEAPALLFVRGSLDVVDARRVGVIGTRNATRPGLLTARELGAELARAGVTVVSGLARGVDGAAHGGVRQSGGRGRPLAVVGNGLDRPYPVAHAELWEWVADDGALVSEWPPGVGPDAWRFPQRNRILAAFSEVLVVVESRERGGSLITARAAADRGIDVMAVPGSPRVRAAAGTNQLLVDGAAPVTSVDDVLAALGLDHRRAGRAAYDGRPRPDALQQVVLDGCREGPRTLDDLVAATEATVAEVALAAARLERSGWLVEAGGWFELAGSLFEASRTVDR